VVYPVGLANKKEVAEKSKKVLFRKYLPYINKLTIIVISIFDVPPD